MAGGDQILRRGGATTVGHELKMRACFPLEKHSGDMRRASDARMSLCSLVRVGFQPRDAVADA